MTKKFNVDFLKSEYKKKFPENWIEKENWNSSEERKSYLKCKKIIDYFSELFFVTFSYSILSGEFIRKKTQINFTIDYLLKISTKEYGGLAEKSNFEKKYRIILMS